MRFFHVDKMSVFSPNLLNEIGLFGVVKIPRHRIHPIQQFFPSHPQIQKDNTKEKIFRSRMPSIALTR